jgi:protein-tyrosine sulfotransferase
MGREDTERIGIDNTGPWRSPVVVLGYAYNGAGYVQRLLSRDASLAFTSGTGLLPLCELAATTWQRIEEREVSLSLLAITSIRAMTGSMITTTLAASGKTRWCEIAFTHPRCAEIFRQIYPSAKFICLHRSCPGVIYSGVKANPWGLVGSALQSFTGSYPGNSVAAIAAYWVASTEPLLEFEQAHPDDCRRVRYEDMLRNPAQEYAEISAFLSLEQDDSADRYSIDEGLPYSAEDGNWPDAESKVPFNWIPQPLMARVDQLMARVGYQPIPGSGEVQPPG